MTQKILMVVVDAIAAAVVVDAVAASQVQMAPTLTLQMKAQIVQRIPAKIPQKVQLIAVAVAAVQLAKV
jgi:hypothetical protein